MTKGEKAIWADINNILSRVNLARSKHGLSNVNLTTTTTIQKDNINTLVIALQQANNAITSSTVNMSQIQQVNNGDIIKEQTVKIIYDKAYEVYNHCTCNSNCTCDCNYCSCYYDNCSCDCDDCSCDCDDCSCDCDYGCSTDCTCDSYHCNCDCNYCSCEEDCTCDCDYGCTCQCYQCPDGGCGCDGDGDDCRSYSCSYDQT